MVKNSTKQTFERQPRSQNTRRQRQRRRRRRRRRESGRPGSHGSRSPKASSHALMLSPSFSCLPSKERERKRGKKEEERMRFGENFFSFFFFGSRNNNNLLFQTENSLHVHMTFDCLTLFEQTINERKDRRRRRR